MSGDASLDSFILCLMSLLFVPERFTRQRVPDHISPQVALGHFFFVICLWVSLCVTPRPYATCQPSVSPAHMGTTLALAKV
jgi:hypothetical protein